MKFHTVSVVAVLSALLAGTPLPAASNAPLEIELRGPTDVAPDERPAATLVLNNPRKTAARVEVRAVLQSDPYLADLDFDGHTKGKSTAIPVTGEKIAEISRSVRVPALGKKTVTLSFGKPLTTGSYCIVARIADGDRVTLTGRRLFGEPAPIEVAASSRFGLNAARWSLAEEHVKLGIGWVRFENFKWPMVSGKANHYSFHPGPAPWRLDVDDAIKTYTDAGLNVLPMMFLTPDWAADDVPGLKENVKLARVPRDPRKFGQFAFQTAARFGSRKVNADKLLTDDKISGKNQIRVFELGNEPNLNPLRGGRLPGWGPWVGTMDQFWEIYRAGATAIKEADPDAKVASPGFAGMTCETVDAMRIHTYADGTHPIDYCDMLSVHFYSGRTPPEIATRDSNNATDLDVTFDEHVRRTVEWRDRYRPGIPIWLTETGYDTSGPIGTNERTQAARLPRVIMIALHNGFDKVLVYRESGSTPTRHAASGVLRNDFTRRPSWYTYATLIRRLHGATPDAQLRLAADNAWAYTWNRDGRLLLTAWTVTGTAQLNLELGKATVTDAFGKSRTVNGTADLRLTEFPLYISHFAGNGELDTLRDRAKAERSARKVRLGELARLKTYLFDFGDNKEPQSTNIGRMRRFTKVPAERVYSADNGFGFEEKPGEKNEFWHWRRTPIERHAVNTYATNFRCDVEAGEYQMRLKVTGPAGSEVTIDTGSRRQTVKIEKDKPIDLTVDADRGYVRIVNPGRAAYHYLTLVEAE